MQKIKVFGGKLFRKVDGKLTQVRTVVATTSQKKAAQLLGITLHELRNNWSEIEEEYSYDKAIANLDVVLWASSYFGHDYTKMKPD